MKRQISIISCLVVIVAMMLSLASCDLISGLENLFPSNQPAPHEHNFVDGVCDCGELAPHEHTFVDGKCECGESDPDYVPTSGEMNVTTTDTYCYDDEYTFTAVGEGNYTFTVPAGLGLYSLAQFEIFGAAEVDFYENTEGATAVFGLEAGETLTFYVGSQTKGDWTLTWTYEACDVEDKVEPGPSEHVCTYYESYWAEGAVMPTCTTGGIVVYMCYECGNSYTQEVGPDLENGHDYITNEETYVSATCSKDGFREATCSYCGDHQEYVLDSETYGWHNLVTDEETFVQVTCQSNGYEKQSCTDCDYFEEYEYEASAEYHKNEYTSNYCIGNCTVCGTVTLAFMIEETETTYGISLSTSYFTGLPMFTICNYDYSLNQAYGASYTFADGVYTLVLTNDYEQDDVLGLLNATITVKPAFGGVYVTITLADGTVIELNNDEHTHEYEESVTPPSCTAPGYTTYTCACGESYTGNETAQLEHDYDHVVTDPTCTAGGYTTHTCAFCDYSYTDSETEALGHADGNADYKCDKCSTKMLPADGTALTIPQALAVAKAAGTAYTTEKYYITGIVTNVYNATYGNLYLKDADGNEICIYGLYTWNKEIRYDKMDYKPVEGDELTVYTVLGMYNTTCQGKDAWVDEVVAHTHDYTTQVTDPTCTKGGYTTHTCNICQGYYVDNETEALGHTTENGVCERCELTIGGDVVNNETFTADFNTVSSTNSSYVKSTTTSGWVATNCAVMGGGTSDANPKFKVFGDAATRAFTMNGKTSAKGTIVSPTISGGISYLSFNFTNCFSESNGVDITITIKQNGVAVATKNLDQNSVTKLSAYTFEWDLAAEGVAVKGDFTIEFTNNAPSKSTSNKDRVSIWNVQWTTNY